MYTLSPPKSKQTQFERRMTYDFLPLFGQSRLCCIFCMDWDFLQGVCWNIYSFPFLSVRDKGCTVAPAFIHVDSKSVSKLCWIDSVSNIKCFIVKDFSNTYRVWVKIKTLWEGHKLWKKSSTCFDIYSVTLKQVGDFCGLFRKPELSYSGYSFSVIVLIHFLYCLIYAASAVVVK